MKREYENFHNTAYLDIEWNREVAVMTEAYSFDIFALIVELGKHQINIFIYDKIDYLFNKNQSFFIENFHLKQLADTFPTNCNKQMFHYIFIAHNSIPDIGSSLGLYEA